MNDEMRELHSLSALVVETLDAQQQYFRKRGTPDAQRLLIESKRLERQLRERAKSYLEVTQL